MGNISKNSVIEPGAKIAKTAVVGPFCHIGCDVEIGSGCVLENNVIVAGKTKIGEGTHVFPLVRIGELSGGDGGWCEIGSANSIREHVEIAGGSEDSPTRTGINNLIMVACSVGSGTKIGDHVILANTTELGANCVVEDYVRTSAYCRVCDGILVGAYAFIAGYVNADRTVPAYSIVQGEPMRVRGVNTHNLHACGFGEDDIRELKRVFRDLFNGGGNINEVELARLIADETACVYIRKVVDTILAQRNSNCKGAW